MFLFVKEKESGKWKFCPCPRCIAKTIVAISIIALLGLLFFRVSTLSANAQDFIIQPYSSVEARIRMLEIFIEGKLRGQNTEFLIEQSSDEKRFLLRSRQTKEGNIIRLIPENLNGGYTFPTKGTWQLEFDSSDKITRIMYLFQNNLGHRIEFSPYQNSSEISLILDHRYLYQNILIPIPVRNVLQMPFEQFLQETNELLYWDWVFLTQNFNDINARSMNLANYLSSQADIFKESRLNNFFEEVDDPSLNELQRREILAQRRQNETNYIRKNVDLLMDYIGTSPVDASAFDPYDVNKNKIANHNEEYLKFYIQNIENFLKEYPAFHTSVKELRTPFIEKEFAQLDTLYIQLYLMTTKNPGLWYIVPIQRVYQDNEMTRYTTISMEVVIPYFTLDGTFVVYGLEKIQAYLYNQGENEAGDASVTYLYSDLGILRVPSQRLTNKIIRFNEE